MLPNTWVIVSCSGVMRYKQNWLICFNFLLLWYGSGLCFSLMFLAHFGGIRNYLHSVSHNTECGLHSRSLSEMFWKICHFLPSTKLKYTHTGRLKGQSMGWIY